jgi:ABC-2 type transport system ATP-binding protein
MIRYDAVQKAFRSEFLRKRRGVLTDFTLEVPRGETYALLGANGAGKTTAMKILLDLIRADGGTVTICGVPTSEPRSRARLGFLPEHPYFFPHLTGSELVRYYGRLSGLEPRRVEEEGRRLMQRLGLAKAESRRVRTYSKGMLQRLGFAQALVGAPDLLVLDEPLSGLDPVGRKEIREFLLELKARGVTIFLSSHILEDVERLCDRAGFLVGGRIRREVEEGGVRYLEVNAEGIDPETLRQGDRLAGKIVREGEKICIALSQNDDLSELTESVRAGGGRILSVRERRESLEDLFVENVTAYEGEGGVS